MGMVTIKLITTIVGFFLIFRNITVGSANSYSCKYDVHCFLVNNSNSTGPGSLHDALQEAGQYASYIEIFLQRGTFPLSSNFSFVNGTFFTLKGYGPNETIINCTSPSAGFFFSGSKFLYFNDTSIVGCGLEFTTTSVNSSDISFLKSRAAMFFSYCAYLTFENLKVEGSNGFGTVIYDTRGNNYFNNCQFSNNMMRDSKFLGGGGLVLETSYCYPGDLDCSNNSTVYETTGAKYVLENCGFYENTATVGDNSPAIKSFPHGRSHITLGSGAALSIVLKGHATLNEVVISSSSFNDNHAGSGGAIYLAFGDASLHNNISFSGCSFSNNYASVGAGGAVQAKFISVPQSNAWKGYTSDVAKNSIYFNNTSFESNFGLWGGGFSLSATRNIEGLREFLNGLYFTNCSFIRNKATLLGSAVDLSSWKPDVIEKQMLYMRPVFKNCNFASNKFQYEGVYDHPLGFGAVYINELPVKFEGSNTFYNNTETALVISGSYINLSTSSKLTFSENQGRRGGAVAFIGDSWMKVKDNVSVNFYSNRVGIHGLGGAIYLSRFNDHDLSSREDCFFRHHDFTAKPGEWKAAFLFKNNTADGYPNSIYTTSIMPCKLNDGEPTNLEDNMFCYNSTWIFEDEGRNCYNEITTGPNRIEIPSIISIYPGWKKNFYAKTYNDYNQQIPSMLTVSSVSGNIAVSDSTRYTSDGNVVIYGIENTTDNKILVMTPDPRVIMQTLVVNVLSCPLGFQASECQNDNSSLQGLTCDCICRNVSGIECNNDSKEAYLESFSCATESLDNDTIMAIAKCPYNSINLPLTNYKIQNLSLVTCNESNRKGFLCSYCIDGYGVSLNDFGYKCVQCNVSRISSWTIFFFIQVLPITLACFLILIFRVNMASPSMNAFLFFSQVILYDYYYNEIKMYGTDYYNPALSNSVLFLYGIFNLKFSVGLEERCLDKSFSTLQIVLIKYLNAFYPILVLLFCSICIKIYYRNYRLLHRIWSPFWKCIEFVRPKMRSSSSVINAITTILVLSYSKVLQLSYPLVAPVSIYNSFSNTTDKVHSLYYYFQPSDAIASDKFFYFMFGLAGLIFFVGIPPIFLALYPCSFMQTCVEKMNTRLIIVIRTFADSFYVGFKDGTNRSIDCRWISSAYLIFRIIIFVANIPIIDTISRHLIQAFLYDFAIVLFAIVRPYKNNIYNYLDISVFTLLNLIVLLNLCNYWYVSKDYHPNGGIYYLGFALTLLPLLYLLSLISFKLLEKVLHKFPIRVKKQNADITSSVLSKRTYNSEIVLPFEDNEDLPDRLLHPKAYESLSSFSTAKRNYAANSGVKKEAADHRVGQSEKSNFLGNKRSRRDYGSVFRSHTNKTGTTTSQTHYFV